MNYYPRLRGSLNRGLIMKAFGPLGPREGLKTIQYDLIYLVLQSMWLDLLILFKTIKVMVRGKGT
jgi:hypothetical protein